LDFVARANQHRVAEIAAEHRLRACLASLGFQAEEQVARAAAEVEYARVGMLQDMAHAAHRARAPQAVQVEREQVVGQVVAMRHTAEHAADPPRGLLFVARAYGGCTAHTRAARMASSTGFSSMPGTTVTSPMRTGST